MMPKRPFNFGAIFERSPEEAGRPSISERAGQTLLNRGEFVSPNFKKGSMGWMIDEYGNAEFNSGVFRGRFEVGGTLITINDITQLQDTIDLLESLGGGTVSLVPGTYLATTSFTLPSNINLEGNGSTIDFSNGSTQILIQGSNAYSTGTVAVSYGSTSVVGTGTTWTSAMVGQSILIGDYWYEITAFTDATHITIGYSTTYSVGQGFIGKTVSGVNYVIATTVEGVEINDLTLYNTITSAIRFRYVNGLILDGVFITNATTAIDGDDSANITYQNYTVDDCIFGVAFDNVPFCVFKSGLITNVTSGTGLALNGVTNTALDSLSIQAITGVGAQLTNCANFSFSAFSIIEASSHGLELVSGNNDIDILTGYVDACGGDGIKLTASSKRNSISSCSILNNGGYGINIVNSTSQENIVGLNAFGASIRQDATITFLQVSKDATDQSTYNFTSTNFGTAASGRYLICAVSGRTLDGTSSGSVITSVTIGGVAATLATQVQNSGNTVGIYIALVPTGTSGTVQVVFNETMTNADIAMYSTTNINSTTPFDFGTSTADPGTTSLDVQAGGIALGLAKDDNGAHTALWSNLTEKYDEQDATGNDISGAASAFATTQSALAVQVQWSGVPTRPVTAFASFSPIPSTPSNALGDLNDGGLVTKIANMALSDNGAPSSVPYSIGQTYADKSGGKVYISTGITSSTDWKLLN